MKTAILWFRRDLRLLDNPALQWLCENADSIIPVYIHSPDEEQPWAAGSASRWWLHHSLSALDKQLQRHGLKLHYFSGSSQQQLANIANKTGAQTLVYNKLYEPHLQARDALLQQHLETVITTRSFESGLFFSPGRVLNQQQKPYRVYTPFYKKVRPQLNDLYGNYSIDSPHAALDKLTSPPLDFDLALNQLGLLDTNRWHQKLHHHWQPGELNSLQRAENFLDDAIERYSTDRDIPSVNGSSCLSPALHFGEITPQQIYTGMLPLLNGACGAAAIQSAEVFLKQLIWREFAAHILWHFPHTMTQAMDPRYSKSFWRANKRKLNAWQQGQTGVAMIDAGMKQLWESGWMHNRVRMIVSSFLTKNLGISWIDGASWFWDTLVDADLANNNMGWQWVAGCGVDAAPYYRIFNPLTQTKRFDPAHQYINTWVPGYNGLEDGITPIVDLAESRNAALERYKQHITAGE